MAIESTAINDLIAGLQQRPLHRDSDDWLFGERDDATEIDTSHEDNSTSPFDRAPSAFGTPTGPLSAQPFAAPQPFVPLPKPFVRQPAAAIEYAMHRPSSATSHVRVTDWRAIAKKLALPIGVFCIVIVVLGVYFAKTDTTKPAAAAKLEPRAETPKVVSIAAPQPDAAPVVTPINEAKTEPTVPQTAEAPADVKVEAKVEEVKVEAKAEEVKVEAKAEEVKVEAKAEPVKMEAKAEPVKVEPVKVEAKPEAKPVEPKVEAKPEVVNVEPGSPASRFLGTAPTQPTIPTVPAKAAPAPTTVPNLAPPAAKPAAMPATKIATTSEAKPAVAKAAPAKPAPARVAKKSAAQLRAERRVAAKAAAKASIAAAKARSKKKVATVEHDEADDTDEADETPPSKPAPSKPAPSKPDNKVAAKPTGKGVLSIASTPAMEVWVDGRNSNAQTPVRIILLSGKHKVTLFDKEHAKAKSFEIEIKPDETTKIVKTYE